MKTQIFNTIFGEVKLEEYAGEYFVTANDDDANSGNWGRQVASKERLKLAFKANNLNEYDVIDILMGASVRRVLNEDGEIINEKRYTNILK